MTSYLVTGGSDGTGMGSYGATAREARPPDPYGTLGGTAMKTRRAILLCALVVLACACAIPLPGITRPLAEGTAAPALTLPSVTGEMISLTGFEGQPVLLNFWTTT